MFASAKEADAVQASDKKTFLLSSNVSFIHDPATFMRKTSRNSTYCIGLETWDFLYKFKSGDCLAKVLLTAINFPSASNLI